MIKKIKNIFREKLRRLFESNYDNWIDIGTFNDCGIHFLIQMKINKKTNSKRFKRTHICTQYDSNKTKIINENIMK